MDFNENNESRFIQACLNGSLDIVMDEIRRSQGGKIVNQASSVSGFYPLMFAVLANKKDVVKILIENGAWLNKIILSGKYLGLSVFFAAAIMEHFDLLAYLLEALFEEEIKAYFDINILDTAYQGKTLLWIASKHKRWDIVEQLLELGVKNYSSLQQKDAPLLLAALSKEWDIVHKMINLGAGNLDEPSKTKNESGITILYLAVLHQQWKLVDILLHKGARNVNAGRQDGGNVGITVLWLIALFGAWDLLNKLLEFEDCNLDTFPLYGVHKHRTILWFAIEANQQDVVLTLLRKGASLEIEDCFNIEFFHDLIEKCSDEGEDNFEGMRNIIEAAHNLYEIANGLPICPQYVTSTIIPILNTSLNAKVKGKTALQCAIERHNETHSFEKSLLALLLKNKADLFITYNGYPIHTLRMIPEIQARVACSQPIVIRGSESKRFEESKRQKEFKLSDESKRSKPKDSHNHRSNPKASTFSLDEHWEKTASDYREEMQRKSPIQRARLPVKPILSSPKLSLTDKSSDTDSDNESAKKYNVLDDEELVSFFSKQPKERKEKNRK